MAAKTEKPSAMVGPYLLVRAFRSTTTKIYHIYRQGTLKLDSARLIATIWVVSAPEHYVDEEWRIRCHECPQPVANNRQTSPTQGFATRERAIEWYSRHRQGMQNQYRTHLP